MWIPLPNISQRNSLCNMHGSWCVIQNGPLWTSNKHHPWYIPLNATSHALIFCPSRLRLAILVWCWHGILNPRLHNMDWFWSSRFLYFSQFQILAPSLEPNRCHIYLRKFKRDCNSSHLRPLIELMYWLRRDKEPSRLIDMQSLPKQSCTFRVLDGGRLSMFTVRVIDSCHTTCADLHNWPNLKFYMRWTNGLWVQSQEFQECDCDEFLHTKSTWSHGARVVHILKFQIRVLNSR